MEPASPEPQDKTALLDKLAQEMIDINADQKAFRKEHKEIFTTNTEFNRRRQSTRTQIAALMGAAGINFFEKDGQEFELRNNLVPKHNMEELNAILSEDSEDKDDLVAKYMARVSKEKCEVLTRRSKRKRKEDSDDEQE
ncbi:Hypothetical Protein FCC1311_048502 [Hondaea fermentalgiana]|uniref:Uncharacterized protein n=1 Tax=Hondaea fermentalgiana TaxID=2315210 RepID=A0A2R5GE76_9STRA|nr:Hypothetical Protein FCC1311_048502 [Hondaea fermentalgiana]|eukprot:GBG28629.1 Hypothetical Protein FCC1311_048502 [Hondaea fermentalgiana]